MHACSTCMRGLRERHLKMDRTLVCKGLGPKADRQPTPLLTRVSTSPYCTVAAARPRDNYRLVLEAPATRALASRPRRSPTWAPGLHGACVLSHNLRELRRSSFEALGFSVLYIVWSASVGLGLDGADAGRLRSRRMSGSCASRHTRAVRNQPDGFLVGRSERGPCEHGHGHRHGHGHVEVDINLGSFDSSSSSSYISVSCRISHGTIVLSQFFFRVPSYNKQPYTKWRVLSAPRRLEQHTSVSH